jgi:hypothetical protein
MANNTKQRLQGLLRPTPPTDTPSVQRGLPYPVGTPAVEDAATLPPQAGSLPEPLQIIARNYLGARRRSGEALLEAARWLHEARTLASHGDWKLFKEATGTSDDTAERLLNIHIQAMQNPQFADSVARNWLSQSAAALLARESTPPSVMETMLNAPEPPSVEDVKQALRQSQASDEAAGGGDARGGGRDDARGDQAREDTGTVSRVEPAWLAPLCERLSKTAEACQWSSSRVADLDEEAVLTLQSAVEQLLLALAGLTDAFEQRSSGEE